MESIRKNLISWIYSYLRFFAKLQLKKHKVPIIAVTGTAGKSTIVLAIVSILQSRYKVLSSYQKGMGLNSRTGIPFVILGIFPTGYGFFDWLKYLILCPIKLITNWTHYDYLVLEYGIDVENEMDDLIKIAVPDIAVWINTGATHIANFSKNIKTQNQAINTIAEQESKLITALKVGSTAILRLDDPHMKKQLKEWRKMNKTDKLIISSKDVKSEIVNGELSFEFIINNKPYRSKITKYALTHDHPYSLIASMLVAMQAQIPIKESIKILEEDLTFPKGRNTIINGVANSLIIDSSYNSSPDSLKSAIELLASYKSRPKIAVLGDMRELGSMSSKFHFDAAAFVASKLPKDSLIVTIGPMMGEYFSPEMKKLGFDNIINFSKTGDAGRYLQDQVYNLKYRSSVILIKGSQNTIFSEIIVEMLMVDKSLANSLLTRRGIFWDKQRKLYI